MTSAARLTAAAGAAACVLSLHAQPAPPNIVFVTIDTVRADHLGAYGYTKGATPTLDRLSHEGVRFADATSQAPLTGPAHAALLTGTYPARLGVRDNATTPLPPGVTTMAELFKARGYRTGAFIGAFIVDAQYGFGRGFDTFDAQFAHFDNADKINARRPGGEVTDAAVHWIDAAPRSGPIFAWVHLYDAHGPYDAPAPYRARFAAAPYDAAIAYVDACIGRIVSALEQTGRLETTIVAVVADHGEGLGEHGEKEHGMFLYDAVLHVPWIMRLPGRQHAGTVVATQVRSIDVMPTLAELAHVSIPEHIDGESVVPSIDGRPRPEPPPSYAETYYPKLHFGLSELASVRVGDWKYIDAPRPELYQVSRDRAERTNVIGTRAALAAGLSGEAQKIAASFGAATRVPPKQPDADTLARLKSLGYAGVVTTPASAGRGIDPKDAIGGVEQFRAGLATATRALSHGDAAAALPVLERLLPSNTRSYELHLALGDAYLGTKKYQRAEDEYAAASLLNPTAAAPVVAAARSRLERGDVPGARQRAADAERLEPGSGEIAFLRGLIAEQLGLTAEALQEYEAALEANGSDASARARAAAAALQLGRIQEAREQFTMLLRLGYRPSRMHFGLGQAAQAEGDLKQAAAQYRESLRLEPAFAPARAALAAVTRPRL
ncbi:MAG TPA: sulfatase-like hydrolase/transferase [Vicinamibacterales bacterium]|nr:sulfatase-like hydrolase/transferase [Vicinamibacterales bacterium]